MEILLTLTLSDRLFDLLEDKLPNFGRRVEKALTKEIGRVTREQSEINVSISPSPTPTVKAEAPVSTEGDAAEHPAVPAVEKPAETAPAFPSKEDVREAMKNVRYRFEGEDYLTNTESEAYRKYHKQVNAVFKQIAVGLGAEKPLSVPEDRRADFITACEELYIGEDGNITSKMPF